MVWARLGKSGAARACVCRGLKRRRRRIRRRWSLARQFGTATCAAAAPTNANALWMAAWSGSQSTFDRLWTDADLYQRQALADASNDHGWRAVHFACVSGQLAMLAPLLEGVEGQAGAVTYTGWSAIHFAAGFGKVDAVDALLDAGADLESQNTRGGHHAGWTPWHRAVRWWLSPGKPNCIQHLLELGVVADARTDQDMTVAKLANPEIHDALELQLRRLPRPSASAERLLDELMQVKADWAEAGHGHQG